MEKMCKSFQIVHEDCCKQRKPWEIMFSLRKDQDSNIKINIRNILKMFATLFIVMLLFPNSLQEHKQENLTTVQKSSGSGKGGQSYCGWLPFLSDNVSN